MADKIGNFADCTRCGLCCETWDCINMEKGRCPNLDFDEDGAFCKDYPNRPKICKTYPTKNRRCEREIKILKKNPVIREIDIEYGRENRL